MKKRRYFQNDQEIKENCFRLKHLTESRYRGYSVARFD